MIVYSIWPGSETRLRRRFEASGVFALATDKMGHIMCSRITHLQIPPDMLPLLDPGRPLPDDTRFFPFYTEFNPMHVLGFTFALALLGTAGLLVQAIFQQSEPENRFILGLGAIFIGGIGLFFFYGLSIQLRQFLDSRAGRLRMGIFLNPRGILVRLRRKRAAFIPMPFLRGARLELEPHPGGHTEFAFIRIEYTDDHGRPMDLRFPAGYFESNRKTVVAALDHAARTGRV